MDNQTSTNLNLDLVMEKMGEKTKTASDKVNDMMKNSDPSDVADMLEFQKSMMDYTMVAEVQSSLVKRLGDLLQSVARKIN